MKKMFFTAITLIAFTGASMANTKEVKPVNPVKKSNTKKVVLGGPCSTAKANNKAYLISGGYTETQAESISQTIWEGCMCSTWSICN